MTHFKTYASAGVIAFAIGTLLLWENVFVTFSWFSVLAIIVMMTISYVLTQVSLLPTQTDTDNLAWFAFLNTVVLAIGFGMAVLPGIYYLTRYSQSTWTQYRYGRRYGTAKLLRYTGQQTRQASPYYLLQFVQLVITEIAVFLVFSLVPMITGHWVLAWFLSVPAGYYGLYYVVQETYHAWLDFEALH